MSRPVIETVTFRLVDGMSQEQFLEAAQRATAFLAAHPGFLRRRLSCEANGTWIEHVEWATMADAEAAADAIWSNEHAEAFLRAIDSSSIKLTHSELKVSVG